jgi:NRPS condensation-like uncharacterized protein
MPKRITTTIKQKTKKKKLTRFFPNKGSGVGSSSFSTTTSLKQQQKSR